MTKTFESAVNIDINIKDADKITDSKKGLNELDQEAKRVKNGMDSATKSVGVFATATGGLKDSLNGVSNNFSKLNKDMGQVPGVIGYAAQSVYGLVQAFKVLIANPIGLAIAAIVVAITLLYKAFASTDEGGERINAQMAKLSAYLNVLRDLAAKFGGKLIEMVKNPRQAIEDFGEFLKSQIQNRIEGLINIIPNLGRILSKAFKGDFAGAAKIAIDSTEQIILGVKDFSDKVINAAKGVKSMADEMQREGDIAANLSRQLDTLEDKERELGVERAKQQKSIAKARLDAENENLPIQKRIEALQKVAQAEEALSQKEAQIYKQRLGVIQAQNALSDKSNEALQKEADAKIKVADLETASFLRQKRLATTIESLQKQEIAKAKATATELEAIEKAKQEKIKAQKEKALKDEEQFITDSYNKEKVAAYQEITDAEKLAERLKEIEQNKLRDLIRAKKDAGIEDTALELQQAEGVVAIAADKKAKLDKIDQDKIAKDKAIAQAEQDIFNNSVSLANAIVSLAGEQSKTGKALALATIAANTGMAISNAIANASNPSPLNAATNGLYGIGVYIGLAASILQNAKQARDIVMGNGTGGNLTPSSNVPQSAPLEPRTFRASAIPDEGFNRDYKVYVLEGEITKTQKRVRDIESVSVVE
jgi:hypothetical protein